MHTYVDVVDLLKRDFSVPDIVLETSSCLFVLESPHVQELKHQAPVSGNSGATMSKHIFGPEYAKLPLGRLVKKNADEKSDRPRLNGIGLINVSNIPLQRLAYGKASFPMSLDEWFDAMATVRTNNQTTRFNSTLAEEIQSYLIAALRSKLEEFRGQSITIIPCGRFAQKFVRLADIHDAAWTIIDNVPHPSYNSWDRPQYQTAVEQVVRAVVAAAKTR